MRLRTTSIIYNLVNKYYKIIQRVLTKCKKCARFMMLQVIELRPGRQRS